jgi:hypothetical protein
VQPDRVIEARQEVAHYPHDGPTLAMIGMRQWRKMSSRVALNESKTILAPTAWKINHRATNGSRDPIRVKRLPHIALGVRDLPRRADFYVNACGLEFVERAAGHLYLWRPGTIIMCLG